MLVLLIMAARRVALDMVRHAATTGWSVTAETVRKLCQQWQLNEAVEAMGILVQTDCRVSQSLFYAVLKICGVNKDLELGRRVHALTVETGYESDTFLCNHVVRMYGSHGRLDEAMDVFTMVAKPDAFMWSSIISAHVKHGQAKQAIQLYHRMCRSSVKPDGHVFVAALQACARAADLETGQQVHAAVLASGVEPHLFVSNCLVDMYAKCCSLADAHKVFDALVRKDVVTWNAMIAGYAQQGMGQEALNLYGAMQQEGSIAPDSVTFVCLLQACANVGAPSLKQGKRLHEQITEQGLEADMCVANSLVNMYAKCGSLEGAHQVFDRLVQKDVVTWTALIAGYSQQGMGEEALHLFRAMREESVSVPNALTFVSLLHACASVGSPALEKGKQLHAQIGECGLEADVFVANNLVNMYAKCGSLDDAQRVFDGLGQKDVVTWTALIAGYSQQGMGQGALDLYTAMQEDGIAVADAVMFVHLLQACASVGIPALEKGKQLHAQMRGQGLKVNDVVGCSLVNMYVKCGSLEDAQGVFGGLCSKNIATWTTLIAGYAKCGSLEEAQRVFDGLGQKDVVTWNALIAGYVRQGMGQEALRLYRAMQLEGMVPDTLSFVCLLQACASIGNLALEEGKQLHIRIREQGHQADVFVANSLVDMYVKCGSLEDAQKLFDGLGRKDVVTWTALIAGYSQQGLGQEALHLYSAMKDEGLAVPDAMTFASLLQACACVGAPVLENGKELHRQIGEQGLQVDEVLGCSLLNMYVNCGSLEDAQLVFDRLAQKNVLTWTTLIAGYSQQGLGHEALHIYSSMEEEAITAPDSVTLVCLLQACASVGTSCLEKGKQFHAKIREGGLEADVAVASSLVNMYAACGSLVDAQSVFDGLSQKSVLTWNAMIGGYSREGMGQEALSLHRAMQEEGLVAPNSVTFVCLLQACASVGTPALEKGMQFHAQIRECGLQADVFVASSLVNMYAKCGSLEDAHDVFYGVSKKDVVMWNAMIAGYSHQGMGQEAFGLYRAMQEEGVVVPNSVTFVCLLQACANVAALHLGRQIHLQIEKQGLQTDVLVAISLINMYARSGSTVDAQQVFEALPERDVIAWNALIAGYARQGESEVVFHLFHKMREDGIQPEGITFLSVLTACSHAGLVNKGRKYFEAMSRRYSITPSVEHYTCMVDLLGRAGELDEALALVRTMPVLADTAVWHSLLGACSKWTNVDVGRHAFDEAMKLDGKDAAAYVLMSNIYAGAQMWELARKMQAKRKEIGAWKQPGQSWWTDMEGMVHSFLVGDDRHPESGCIYAKLKQLLVEKNWKV